jgi:hypothetical protein
LSESTSDWIWEVDQNGLIPIPAQRSQYCWVMNHKR